MNFILSHFLNMFLILPNITHECIDFFHLVFVPNLYQRIIYCILTKRYKYLWLLALEGKTGGEKNIYVLINLFHGFVFWKDPASL